MRNQHTAQDEGGFSMSLRPILIGTSFGVLSCAVFLLICAAAVSSAGVPQGAIEPFAIAASTLGALVGGLVSARISRCKGIVYGALTGVAMLLIFFIVSLCSWHNAFDLFSLLRFILMPAGGAAGGVFGVNIRRRR